MTRSQDCLGDLNVLLVMFFFVKVFVTLMDSLECPECLQARDRFTEGYLAPYFVVGGRQVINNDR